MSSLSSQPKNLSGQLLAHGIDAVDTVDFLRLLKEPFRSYLDRSFTPTELAYIGASRNSAERLAGRFSVKEAVLKALGLGWGDGIAFTDVETCISAQGAPSVILHRQVKVVAEEKGIRQWSISTSHTKLVTIACVIGTN